MWFVHKKWNKKNIVKISFAGGFLYFCVKRIVRKVWSYQKRYTEAVNQRSTDNTIVKRKKTRINNDLQSITQKAKNRGELRCSGRVNISCSTCCSSRVNPVANTVVSPEREKDRIVMTKNGTYRWSFAAVVSSQLENWKHLLYGNVLFLAGLHYQFRGVGQGMMKT